jgi:hypothetical protein
MFDLSINDLLFSHPDGHSSEILDKNHSISVTKCLTIMDGIQYTGETGE